MSPKIKILAISNVYCRLMNFEKAGDIEEGHTHTYDHGTLLSKGKLKVEMLEENDTIISSKIFEAPTFVYINKDKKHKLTALEDDTVACCIHALRTIDENIIDPDSFIESTEIPETEKDVSEKAHLREKTVTSGDKSWVLPRDLMPMAINKDK